MHKTHLRLVLLAIIAVWLVLLTFMPSHHETEDAGPLPVLGSVSGFVLTNQFGTPFDSRSLEGRVWVADVFFSRCPGPCVRLATNLKRLQDQLPAGNAVRLVSLTADAAYDQPPILERYAERFGADTNRWSFLTGPQAAIYRAATEQLHLAVAENPDPESAKPSELFIHSTKLVLVDQAGRVRGYFDGEDEEVVLNQLLPAILRLEQELPDSPPGVPVAP
ncbi:MAG: SCO family protein [Verrucomicrobiae bacterium]|nr:SCO family protein [Verrucomicrobiae bacterium]